MHTCKHVHVCTYAQRSNDEKTDPLAVSARNASQRVAKNGRRVQRKLRVQERAKSEEKKKTSKGEAKKKRLDCFDAPSRKNLNQD